jgi:hypothetical protein
VLDQVQILALLDLGRDVVVEIDDHDIGIQEQHPVVLIQQ